MEGRKEGKKGRKGKRGRKGSLINAPVARGPGPTWWQRRALVCDQAHTVAAHTQNHTVSKSFLRQERASPKKASAMAHPQVANV